MDLDFTLKSAGVHDVVIENLLTNNTRPHLHMSLGAGQGLAIFSSKGLENRQAAQRRPQDVLPAHAPCQLTVFEQKI